MKIGNLFNTCKENMIKVIGERKNDTSQDFQFRPASRLISFYDYKSLEEVGNQTFAI